MTILFIAYNQKAPFSTVQSIYSDFEPRARRLFELADPDGFRIWKLVDMDDIPRWSLHRTTLLGDAAHTVEPFGFSGASMAIEDALTLATLFGEDVTAGDEAGIQKRLALYERIRKPRVDRVREVSRFNGLAKEDDIPMIQDYMKFLSGHDAVAYAREVMAKEL